MLMTKFRSCPGGAIPAAAALTMLAFAGPAFAQCPATFTVGPAWAMGSPYSVSVGDFNNDGRLDFAGANFTGPGDVTVRLAGVVPVDSYFSSATYPLGLSPRGSVAADFNHDGRADLAVAYNGGGPANVRMAVLIANANGTFQAPVLYPVGWQAYDVRAADVNGDGNVDLLCSASSGTISILRGNANGTFQDAVTVTSGLQATGFVAADANGDGTQDLVTTNYNFSTGVSVVYVALGVPGSNGAGYGSFNPYNPGSFGSWGIASGDFNSDG
ncbi:MAG TPA: VCBS repeat-containing protein, partial [Phycisphaerales bacterium]|nr:VCBS repeat-containing protein [Phycisphaerales bacterium]